MAPLSQTVTRAAAEAAVRIRAVASLWLPTCIDREHMVNAEIEKVASDHAIMPALLRQELLWLPTGKTFADRPQFTIEQLSLFGKE